MATDHHAAIGLAAAKRWKCGKELKSLQGYKGHDCMTVIVQKPRKKHMPVEEIGEKQDCYNCR